MKVELAKKNEHMVVLGVAEFISGLDLSRYANLKPNSGRCVVKMFKDSPEENCSEGGIVIPGQEKDEMFVGVVVACGSGAHNPYTGGAFPVEFQVGDLVFVKENFGHEFVYGTDREGLHSIDYNDLIGKAI